MKKIFAILLAVGILLAGAAGVLYGVAQSRYWADSHLEGEALEFEDISESGSGLEEVKATVHECNEAAVPISDEFEDFFEACNELIFRYFQDKYGIDVTERLDELQVMESTYPEEVSQMVGGSYSGEFPDRLFMNADLLNSCTSDIGGAPEVTSNEFSVKMLRTVYIHEVMHYLGFNSGLGFEHFTEALAESLNKEVMLHGGIKYESITGYAAIQGFAAQVADCDPELVRRVLTDDGFDLSEYFDNRLGENYAEYYDGLIGAMQKSDSEEMNKLTYYTQYLTYEYCKAANSDAREILKSSRETTVSLFEIKWLLGIY